LKRSYILLPFDEGNDVLRHVDMILLILAYGKSRTNAWISLAKFEVADVNTFLCKDFRDVGRLGYQ
jgi:hypothetical protein